MIGEQLPDPEMHENWRDFARALITILENAQTTDAATVQYIVSNTPIDPAPLPTGWLPIWLNSVDGLLYLGNDAYDPPTAPDIVYIDTIKLANAAVNVNKLADGAVSGAKILDATIGSADIGAAQIITALIADAAIVTAKILDLAVNEAKIANLAVTSAKIANLAVGAAHIQAAAIGTAHIGDATVTDAKIGNTIQSLTWNATTKAGWKIDKTGLIQGQGLAIYDNDGDLIFGVDGSIEFSRMLFDETKLTAMEKQTTVAQMYAAVEAAYWQVRPRAVALAVSVTALDAARTAWQDYLNGLNPAWNDFTADTVLMTPQYPAVAWPAGWSQEGTVSPTTWGSYQTLTDNDAGNYERIVYPANAQPASTQFSFGVAIAKDDVGKATRFPAVSIYSNSATFRQGVVLLDTSTGVWAMDQIVGSLVDYGVMDLGADWFVYLTMISNVDANQMGFSITPAIGNGPGGLLAEYPRATSVGSIDVREPVMVLGDKTKLGRWYMLGLYNAFIAAIDATWRAISQVDATLALTSGISGSPFTSLATNLIGTFTSSNLSTYMAAAAIQSAQIADAQITSAKIGDLQVTGAKIADATIAAAKIISLNANQIVATSLSAITATVGLLRTASSGQRLEIHSNVIKVYDSGGVVRVQIGDLSA